MSQGFWATTKFNVAFKGLPAHGSEPEKGKNALLCACACVMNFNTIARHSEGITQIQIGRIEAGTARNIIADEARLEMEVRGQTSSINDYLEKRALKTIEGTALTYECQFEVTCEGRATTYQGDEAINQILEEEAAKLSCVQKVLELNTNVGSEDVSLMIDRVQSHGGKASFFLFGCNHLGHHRHDFDVQDTQSLPMAYGLFTRFLMRTNS